MAAFDRRRAASAPAHALAEEGALLPADATSLAVDHRALGHWREHADDVDVELRDDSGHFIVEELPDVVVARARALFDSS